MTMFEFMVNAFYLLAGVACIAIALVIVYAVSVAIYRAISGGKSNGRNKN